MPLLRASHLFRSLANPVRLRILALVENHELCVCQITTVLGLAASTVSAHVSQLHREHVLERRKDGRWVSYSLAGEHADLVRSVVEDIRGDEQIEKDLVALERVLELDRALLAGSPDSQKLVRVGAPLEEIRAAAGVAD